MSAYLKWQFFSPIGVPFSALADLPRWSTCLDFLAQMNLVPSFYHRLWQ